MSDDQMPTWAKAMEDRVAGSIVTKIEGLADIMTARIEIREHNVLTDVLKAINDSEQRLAQRIEAVAERGLNDTIVAMDVADQAERAVKELREDIGTHARTLRQFWQRLRALEHHVHHGPKPPEPPAVAE